MARRASRRSGRSTGRISDRIPGPLRSLIGGAVLVGAVRTIDVVWRRTTGRRPPLRGQVDGTDASLDGAAGPPDDAAPATVRDRLVYALLLGGALRLARRAGLVDEEDA
jgi:hypothetical protein